MTTLGWEWVEACRVMGGEPTLELFDEAVGAGDEAVALLSRVLARRSWRDGSDPARGAVVVHAIRVMGEIASPTAIPALLGVLRDPGDPSTFGEEAALALARIGEPAFASLERLVHDRGADTWPRALGARALMHAALRDRRRRPRVLPVYEKALREKAETDATFVSLVATCVRHLGAAGLLDALREAHEAGRMDPDFGQWNDLAIDVVVRRWRPDVEEKRRARRDVRAEYWTLAELLATVDAPLAERIAGELQRLRREGADEPADDETEAASPW